MRRSKDPAENKALTDAQRYVELHSKKCFRHSVPARCIPFGRKNKLHWQRYICLECGFMYWFDGDGMLLDPFEDEEYNKRFQRHQLKFESAFGDSPRIVLGVDGFKK